MLGDLLSSLLSDLPQVLLLSRAKKRPVICNENQIVLTYTLLFRLFACFIILFALFCGVLGVLNRAKGSGQICCWIALAGFFLLGGIWMLVESFARLSLTRKGLSYISPWRRQIELSWEEVESLQFSKTNKWFVIRSKRGQKIRVHIYMKGILQLTGWFKAHLPERIFRQADEEFRREL